MHGNDGMVRCAPHSVLLVGYTATRFVTALSPVQSGQKTFWPTAKARSPFLDAVRSNEVNDDEKICQARMTCFCTFVPPHEERHLV
jgi:hypothetical protein